MKTSGITNNDDNKQPTDEVRDENIKPNSDTTDIQPSVECEVSSTASNWVINERFDDIMSEIPEIVPQINKTSSDMEIDNVRVHENTDYSTLCDAYHNFSSSFRKCCIDNDIDHKQTKALLRVLRIRRCFRNFPKDNRTIMKSNRCKTNFLPVEK